ncbi:hypothetical protein FE783_07460 [Paenibacillus mesophilus]|uniref:hypothetical protein n=1 Tax=Paenibacillus mesophilus TaxID=2582849 RepID=UPI00110D9521|nr:hypothetical protein [Paenibacillus mesophilus]TMV51602.1 hypothetical protein FE783_07460 [Paenibacillus mesophilus]
MIIGLLAVVALYTAFLWIGIRSIVRKGRRTDLFLYACLTGWCAYLSLGKLYDWTGPGIVSPVSALFIPVGKWIEQLFGGPPN